MEVMENNSLNESNLQSKGGNIPRQISNVAKVEDKMKEAQNYSLQKEWRKFKEFFAAEKPETLLKPLDWMGNTAMHVATCSNDPQLLRDLLDMLDKDQQFGALIKKNTHGNTVLHHAIHFSNIKMLDELLDVGTRTKEEARNLLRQKNDLGETPVYSAAMCGKIHMLVHLKQYYYLDSKEELRDHFLNQVPHSKTKNSEENSKEEKKEENSKDSRDSGDQDKSILYLAIAGQNMDVAMWLISEVDGIDKLAHETYEDGLNCLKLLSQMPSCFQSGRQDMRSVEKLIYYFLPITRYPDHKYERFGDDDQTDDSYYDRSQRQIESGNFCFKQPTSVLSRITHGLRKFNADVISRINRALWEFIADEWDQIDEIWEKKRQHKLAKKLAELLVKKDITEWEPMKVTHVTSPEINPPNVHPRRIRATLEKTQSMGESTGYRFKSPLHLAASTGIVEIIGCILKRNPEAIAHVEQQQNILHVAVKHRQRGVYRLIKKYGALKWLASEISNEGRTVLHQVARMDYYNGGKRDGVVFQLQDELRWFERVKAKVPPKLILHSNSDKLKASELFEIEHEEMLKEAQEWIKGTAQSCSAVAVLVATVVFAAAYTVPGGVNDNGVPVFLNSPLFLFFTIADVIALACSIVSVMMFLSILTSPFEMESFLKSLPRKLTMGFALLFLSLTITMLAFSSTILLTIRLEKNQWTTSLIYCVTFLPVSVFGLMQFPIYMAIRYRVKRAFKTCKKLLPKRFSRRVGHKKYSKFLY